MMGYGSVYWHSCCTMHRCICTCCGYTWVLQIPSHFHLLPRKVTKMPLRLIWQQLSAYLVNKLTALTLSRYFILSFCCHCMPTGWRGIREELIECFEVIWNIFWTPVYSKCLYTMTPGLNVVQGCCACVLLHWYNKLTSLIHTYLLLGSDDTVDLSVVW